ncbi:unnamed protein product [Hydatigera taeniaeformis]|uniref:Translocon-associated protein subunit alpha n=1 Tax=Hydatigena taeniaeformis TaxID=6205 RepID=A0A0R3WU58_HYDTA|nr:unnamed protein product [Hydatigera taeniaeformis]
MFVVSVLVFSCKGQDDEFMEFYDPDEGSPVEAEGLIHREPARESSFNDFEQPMESESDDSNHESILEIEPDDEEFEGYIPRKVESENSDSSSNKPLLKVAKVSYFCFKMFHFPATLIYLLVYNVFHWS